MKDIVIFDLDGTLADVSERREIANRAQLDVLNQVEYANASNHLQIEAKNAWWEQWEGVPANLQYDKPSPVVDIAKALKALDRFHIVIFSGRTAKLEQPTLQWLSKHQVPYDEIYMRGVNDYRPDSEVKTEMLMQHSVSWRKRIVTIYDDRNVVVDTWRNLQKLPEHNYGVVQVAEGDF